jgi:hypothetical protein
MKTVLTLGLALVLGVAALAVPARADEANGSIQVVGDRDHDRRDWREGRRGRDHRGGWDGRRDRDDRRGGWDGWRDRDDHRWRGHWPGPGHGYHPHVYYRPYHRVWIPGAWSWSGYGWVWVPGYWR